MADVETLEAPAREAQEPASYNNLSSIYEMLIMEDLLLVVENKANH